MAEVSIQEGESLENALRRFKRKVQQEDIIKEIKKHSYYMKPGEKRRAKQALSRKRLRKKQRREQDKVPPDRQHDPRDFVGTFGRSGSGTRAIPGNPAPSGSPEDAAGSAPSVEPRSSVWNTMIRF